MDAVTVGSLVALAGALVAMKVMPRLVAGVPFVPPADLKARMDRGESVLVVDVRSPAEFGGDGGHVPGAINLPVGVLSERLSVVADRLDEYRNTPVFVMCHTSNRSPYGARALKKAGFADVNVVAGGMSRWLREGLPSTRTR
ncbi:MAG: rhodanese-like domain-containing protein [Alphaproteobacteria bacterium]